MPVELCKESGEETQLFLAIHTNTSKVNFFQGPENNIVDPQFTILTCQTPQNLIWTTRALMDTQWPLWNSRDFMDTQGPYGTAWA